MPMTLWFKRAKSFVEPSENDRGTKKFLAQPGPSPQPVPFWVANTPTFKMGIKDGSIVNLTPPEQMPGYKAPKPADPEVDDTPTNDEAEATIDSEPEADVEQTDVPQAPFGGQPMTPVTPAPKVGGVRASTRKSAA